MKTSQAKLFGSLASSVMLVGAGAVVAAPALGAVAADDAVAYAAPVDVATAPAKDGVANVQGDFGYTQMAVTSTTDIAGVFSKAAAVLCTGLPDYAVATAGQALTINGNTSMQATVADMQADEAAASVLMACACATNTAGGGAVANADVSGVTLATVAALVQAL